ncbi:deoxyribonuclease TatD [Nitzschia inconspicua]|uniref:Deoxyribonuclease TatD n=1 Tax=Nitzschia inconspicua TaxID=303405 RepID=A0A9K3KWB3_9STRA|nr:deoxyribonuclease TatD [Nitzschia inconspicua]
MSSPFQSQQEQQQQQQHPRLQFVDIGANLMDDRFQKGEYFGKERHRADFDAVLERAIQAGVTHIILTAGTLEESRQAVQAVRNYRQKHIPNDDDDNNNNDQRNLFLACTVGVHPTRCQQEFIDNVVATTRTADTVLDELRQVAEDGVQDGAVVALGEMGLDYDRLQFSPKHVQQEFLQRQLDVFSSSAASDTVKSLPLFLHNRSVGRDLVLALQQHQQQQQQLKQKPQLPLRGVVHSFDDTLELAQEFIAMGLYIGLNGCSLKNEDNLMVVKELPLSSILVETDCPYCEIKPTHAGYKYVQTFFDKRTEKKFVPGMGVKGRTEPNHIVQVVEVIAGIKGLSTHEVANVCYKNSLDLYGLSTLL